MALFTPQTAAEMAHKRWNAEKQGKATTRTETAYGGTNGDTDPLARDLAEEMAATVQAYRDCDDPKGKAALAQALRNLRETWHMVTGQSKPGNAKPSSRSRSSYPTLDPKPIEPVSQSQSQPGVKP